MSDQLPLTPPPESPKSTKEIWWIGGIVAAVFLFAVVAIAISFIVERPKSPTEKTPENIYTERPTEHTDAITRILYEEEFVIPEVEKSEDDKILIEFLTDLPITNTKPGQAGQTTKPPVQGRIAIIIDDIGVVPTYSKQAITDLPKEITLSFLPYGSATPALVKQANAEGHTVMVHLPMEPKIRSDGTVVDPGPNALMTTDSSTTLINKTNQNLGVIAPYAVGVNNHMGSWFTEKEENMKIVLSQLKKHDLFFLDSVTTSHSAAPKVAKELGMDVIRRDIFIDHSQAPEDIKAALANAVTKAKKYGQIIAIGHPHPETLTALKEWIPTLQEQGIALIPITQVSQLIHEQN